MVPNEDKLFNFTYLDDVPTVDMFTCECEGIQYSATDTCASTNKVNIIVDCAAHAQVHNPMGILDLYWMFDGDDLAYFHFETDFYSYYGYFDTNKKDNSGFAIMSSGGSCEHMYFKKGAPWIPSGEFYYHGVPIPTECPDNTTGCMIYCDNVTEMCVTVDSSMRLIGVNSFGDDISLFNFLNDSFTLDVFTSECNGKLYRAYTDYCSDRSSHDSSKSSDMSSSSHGSPSSGTPSGSPSSAGSSPNSHSSAGSSPNSHSSAGSSPNSHSSAGSSPNSHSSAVAPSSTAVHSIIISSASKFKACLTVVAVTILMALF